MTRTELLIVAYAILGAFSFAWGALRIVRTTTVRQAVEALPAAVLPGWGIAVLVAYVREGLPLALQFVAVAAMVLVALWMMRYGVDCDSGMLETLDEGVEDTRLTSASS